MISFDADSRRFNLRAAAIVLNGSQVLLHRLEGDAFWSFPGGRVEGGELGSSAAVREMAEELAEPVECGQLLWVVQNFFTYRGVTSVTSCTVTRMRPNPSLGEPPVGVDATRMDDGRATASRRNRRASAPGRFC
jgi:8-oxo-dGTP pyrophosphatase MutT (NUDIX family)